MAWEGSTRRQRLPPAWPTLRRSILKRDPLCRLSFADICTTVSTEVDHIKAGDDHTPGNLQGVCAPCHKRKTAAERPRQRRPTEAHPGML